MIPSLATKLNGMSFRVPVVNVSVVDLTVRLKRPVQSINEINDLMRTTSEGKLREIVGYSDEGAVSSDFR